VGTPTFTTNIGTISYLNNFQFGAPSDIITLSFSGTIASSIGAPGLVGQSISYSVTYSEFSGDAFDGSFVIGGTDVYAFPSDANGVVISPPVDTFSDIGGGQFTFTFDPPYDGFGPRTADFPEIELATMLNYDGPVPTREYFLFCENGGVDCAVSPDGSPDGLGLLNPILTENYSYTEGSVQGSITFSTVGGPPVSTVPLPAGGLLLLSALGAVGVARRKRS